MGYGVYQIDDFDECKRGVASALDDGYRLIDTAACYGNERAVGDALSEAAIPREEVSISSKVWIQQNGYEGTIQSFEKTLMNLQTDYLDLYLIHMPYGDYQGSWRAMEDLYDQGRVRAIGLCNFLPDRLIDLILSSRIAPMVNQIELHPFTQQIALRKVMAEQGVVPMAWAPLAEGRRGIFDNPVLRRIGQRYGKTPAQVVLRWLTQQAYAPSRNPCMSNGFARTAILRISVLMMTICMTSVLWIRESRLFLMWIRPRRPLVCMGYLIHSD